MTEPSPSAVLIPNRLWRILHWPGWLFFRLWLRVRCSGIENIDNSRGGLLLINHQSFLDPMLAAVLLTRPVSYLARDSLFRVPVLGWLLRRTYVIPISREAARGGSIRLAVERLEQGFLLGVFPEGTRSSGSEVRSVPTGISGHGSPYEAACLSGRNFWFRSRNATWCVVYSSGTQRLSSMDLDLHRKNWNSFNPGTTTAFCELARRASCRMRCKSHLVGNARFL